MGTIPLVIYKIMNQETKNTIVTILQVLAGLFILWMMFGGYIEKWLGVDRTPSSIYIDCRLPENQYSQYCNGEFESQVNEQEGIENNYYQNNVRY